MTRIGALATMENLRLELRSASSAFRPGFTSAFTDHTRSWYDCKSWYDWYEPVDWSMLDLEGATTDLSPSGYRPPGLKLYVCVLAGRFACVSPFRCLFGSGGRGRFAALPAMRPQQAVWHLAGVDAATGKAVPPDLHATKPA
jgi:hypothetical protein